MPGSIVADFGRQRVRAVAVALVAPGLSPFVEPRPNAAVTSASASSVLPATPTSPHQKTHTTEARSVARAGQPRRAPPKERWLPVVRRRRSEGDRSGP